MKKPETRIEVVKASREGWIDRLTRVLLTVDEMDGDERQAAFRFMKSKYSSDWPSESY